MIQSISYYAASTSIMCNIILDRDCRPILKLYITNMAAKKLRYSNSGIHPRILKIKRKINMCRLHDPIENTKDFTKILTMTLWNIIL